MAQVSSEVRARVFSDARHRCGYCQTSLLISGAQLHIEHIVPLARGGNSEVENLWVACAWCNSYKGAKIAGVDPITQQTVLFF